jgi:hypothetical protein
MREVGARHPPLKGVLLRRKSTLRTCGWQVVLVEKGNGRSFL